MSNPPHYRSGEFLVVVPILFAFLLAFLLFWFASDFWKPIVAVVCSWIAIVVFIWAIIRRRMLRSQSLLVLKGFMISKRRRIVLLTLIIAMAIASIYQIVQTFQSGPFDAWMLAKASINMTIASGWLATWWTDLQKNLFTTDAIHSPASLLSVRWTQIEGHDWQEKEVKGKKYLSLILYIQNWWKIPFFEHLKLKVVVQPDEQEKVEELLRKKCLGKTSI